MTFVLQLSIWNLALKAVIFVNMPNLDVLLDPWDKAVSHILEKYFIAINTYLDPCLITLVHMTNNYLGQSSLKIQTIWCHGVTLSPNDSSFLGLAPTLINHELDSILQRMRLKSLCLCLKNGLLWKLQLHFRF